MSLRLNYYLLFKKGLIILWKLKGKYIPKTLPENLAQYKHHKIEQAYLNTAPVVRIRKQDSEYFLTYKGGGMMAREEYNLPLTKKVTIIF